MKIDTLGLQAFVAIVDHGTFGKAAQALNISQTGLSHRLKNLEAQFGVRLIERTTRAWSLTPAGEMFHPKAKRLIEELNESFRDMRRAAEHGLGSVTVASITTIAFHLLPQAVMTYTRAFPSNHVRVLEMASPAVTDAVLQGRAEFGINVLTRRHPELHIEPVYEESYGLVCRDDHPLSRRRKVQWRDVEGQAVITLGHGSANGMIVRQLLTDLGYEVKALHETQRSSTALALVSLGLGLAILPRLALHAGMYPRLRTVQVGHPTIKRQLALIRRKGVSLTPAAHSLYRMALEEFRRISQRAHATLGA